jgi:hypothetical protein
MPWTPTRGCPAAMSDHGTAKSLYGRDPDGLEFEIAWVVRWVQIDLDEASRDEDHLISPEDRMRVAMARQ